MSFRTLFIVVALFGLPGVALAAKDGPVIKKCQDAQGQWHYGDTAADECAQSKVTEINDRGVKVNEQAAPLTEEELAARKAAKEAAEAKRRQEEKRRKEDQRLLATYDSEAAIIRSRDERLQNIENMIKINQELIKTLEQNLARLRDRSKGADPKHAKALAKEISRAESQIADYKAANEERQKERQQVSERYNADLARYREILQGGKAGSGDGTADTK
jgi:chromosome segregation ATPase